MDVGNGITPPILIWPRSLWLHIIRGREILDLTRASHNKKRQEAVIFVEKWDTSRPTATNGSESMDKIRVPTSNQWGGPVSRSKTILSQSRPSKGVQLQTQSRWEKGRGSKPVSIF
jgi:hypothetical protein